MTTVPDKTLEDAHFNNYHGVKWHAYLSGMRDLLYTCAPGKSEHVINGYLVELDYRTSLSNGKFIDITFKMNDGGITLLTAYPKDHQDWYEGPLVVHYPNAGRAIFDNIHEIVERHNTYIDAKTKSMKDNYKRINELFPYGDGCRTILE